MAEDNKNKKPEVDTQELSPPESPSEITAENAHLVDFENLKVRILCLISIPNAFTSIANFLKRRGWEVLVTTELKEALSQAGTYNPDFVLVSVNHSHKKIKQFPQIIMQTFNVPTIVFGEKTDAKTMSSIQASRANYKIMGHLSGPTAQRKIKKILQDLYQPEEVSKEGNRAFENIGGQGEGAIKFSGPKSEGGGGYNPFKGGGQQGDGPTGSSGSAYDPTQAKGYGEEGPSKQKILSAAEQIQKNKEDTAAALRELGSEIGSGTLNSDEDKDKSAIQSGSNKSTSGYGGLNHDPNNKKNESKTQEGIENKSQGSATQEGGGKKGYVMEYGDVSKKEDGYVMESGPMSSKASNRTKVREFDKQSFIERATITVVNKMRAEEHDNPPGLGVVRRVALLSVGHDKHKGYFMIAGHDIGMSLDDFVQEFTEHFQRLCVERSEAMEFGDYINMDCPDYDFFDNGEDGLEFNFVTSFSSGEVGVKFIHDEEAWAHAEKPENHDKALIKTEQIVEDKPLEIDLFVHLQRNEKYYKIVGKDSELSSDRKEKLIEKKTEVFINENDVGTYRKFQTKQKAMKAINNTVQRTTKKKAS